MRKDQTYSRLSLLIAASIVGLVIAAPNICAQAVAIAPQVIAINASAKSTSVTLVNTGDDVAEVTLSTLYGYPVTDANGVMSLKTVDNSIFEKESITEYVQIFPHKFKLGPKEKRVVRILVKAPKALVDREYWGRLVVATRGSNLPVAGAEQSKGVNVGLALEVRTILPIYFRKGVNETGVAIGKTAASVTGDSIIVRAELSPTHRAAFIGTVKATLKDSKGRIVSQNQIALSVLHPMNPRVGLSKRGLVKGDYTLTVEAVGSRSDIAQNLLLKSQPVRYTQSLSL